MVIRVSHLTDQVEIGGGVHAPILPVERGPAPPPSAGPRSQNPNANPTPSPALDSYTSIPLGGYDDPFLFQTAARFDAFQPLCYIQVLRGNSVRVLPVRAADLPS